MRINGKYLILGPVFHIGSQPIRNVHLIDRGRNEKTVCGRLPNDSPKLPVEGRWIMMEHISAIKHLGFDYKALQCSTCQKSAKEFSANEHTD